LWTFAVFSHAEQVTMERGGLGGLSVGIPGDWRDGARLFCRLTGSGALSGTNVLPHHSAPVVLTFPHPLPSLFFVPPLPHSRYSHWLGPPCSFSLPTRSTASSAWRAAAPIAVQLQQRCCGRGKTVFRLGATCVPRGGVLWRHRVLAQRPRSGSGGMEVPPLQGRRRRPPPLER